jgi:hypothetical protein
MSFLVNAGSILAIVAGAVILTIVISFHAARVDWIAVRARRAGTVARDRCAPVVTPIETRVVPSVRAFLQDVRNRARDLAYSGSGSRRDS